MAILPETRRKLLAIVPARGGSKGVLRKNMRLIGDRPLLDYTLAALQEAGVADRILVSSDDSSILAWADLRGWETHIRSADLAADAATISELAASIADEFDWTDDVGVFQPTSPLRSADSIRDALSVFHSSGYDSLASCSRESHLYWYEPPGQEMDIEPLFTERVNRQFGTPRVLRETGAIQLVRGLTLRSKREMVTARHKLFEVPEHEALDIDTPDDLALARRRLEDGTIIFRLSANRLVGSGHLFHCLQLAEALDEHRLEFLLRDCDPFVSKFIEERGYRWHDEGDLGTDLTNLRRPGVNLIVNDVLDTSPAEVLQQRSMDFLVVNVEDLGEGAKFAHWVVNALYQQQGNSQNVSWGPRWAAVREEFYFPPPKEIREHAARILITFGGTDPNQLGARCANLLIKSDPNLDIRVILGPGVAECQLPDSVTVQKSVNSMAAAMHDADLVLTSAGRTIYEAAMMGVPVLVIAQNAREATHAHLNYEAGVVFLGIGPLVDDSHIERTVERLLGNRSLRQELSDRLVESVDTHGTRRIAGKLRAMMRGEK
ncbi:MAG TPA: hypothetical protein VH853_19990 [Polyangia bacterium]|jgi:CMP-N-acetylneuraminic acid synthetase/spore coat polysaccharide biosynthesis predicted glycosyltransferase SpsG|nr:hypothetical protein [Polyangia bacterium]